MKSGPLLFAVLVVAACQSAAPRPQVAITGASTSTRSAAPAIAEDVEKSSPKSLRVPLTVKEVAGVGAQDHPVTAIVPLPQGRFQDTAALALVDANGAPIPAQFEVLNRHWAKDGSIRHVMVHFQATVGARGDVSVVLDESGRRPQPAKPVKIVESGERITIDTGALTLEITRRPFSIKTPTGPITADLVTPEGAHERSFDATDVAIEIEERGPMRAVIRADSPARVVSPGHVRHGWALRLYAYAGKPWIQVDYQLQNSPMNEVYGAPMYFDSLALSVPSGAAAKPSSVRAADVDADPIDRAAPTLVTQAVQVTMRHFYEMWPNALSVDARGVVSAELFPAWGTRRFGGQPSPLGLHWLDDLQHVVKETLFRFGPSADGFDKLAATFAFHPIVIVPVSWYADTEVTLDMGGVFPRRDKVGDTNDRKPRYANYHHGDRPVALRFGWDDFGVDLYRKQAPNIAGDWPYSSARCLLTEDPADVYAAEDFAMGDLDVRPEWMPHYDHARDFERLQPSENPYGGFSWRRFDGKYGYEAGPGYRPGSGQEAKPRDDQHAWFYHIEEAYYCTGNPWIRDYYRSIAQFRRTRLHQKDPYPDMSSRAVGHSLSNALQAYRVTGDVELLALVGKYLVEVVGPTLDPVTGGYKSRPEAVFQLGFLAHAMVTYLEESKSRDPAVVALLAGLVRWNMSSGRWGYYTEPGKTSAGSDATSMSFCDPQSYYGLLVNDRAVIENVAEYVRHGINGGARPAIDVSDWTGDFNGRITAPTLALVRP